VSGRSKGLYRLPIFLKSEAPFGASDDINLSFVYLCEQVILTYDRAAHSPGLFWEGSPGSWMLREHSNTPEQRNGDADIKNDQRHQSRIDPNRQP